MYGSIGPSEGATAFRVLPGTTKTGRQPPAPSASASVTLCVDGQSPGAMRQNFDVVACRR